MKLKASLVISLYLLACSIALGQIDQYNFLRPLEGQVDQWHKVVLPDEIFSKVSPDLGDLRIFGVTPNNDTIEAPYLLRIVKEQVTSREVSFNMINTTSNQKGYYFTFEIPTSEPLNQMQLNFAQENFDWRLTLEGSQDQLEWFTIVNDYRILSIENQLTSYQFTKITFPEANYHYLRILIDSQEKPQLDATINQHQTTEPNLKNYRIQSIQVNENKNTKQTEVDLELALPVPVNRLKLKVEDTFDYYRPIRIQYLADSFKTEQGWKYNYRTLTSSTLSSVEENQFSFTSTVLKKLKVTIGNHDNIPLTVGSAQVEGYVHELVVRFSDPATYYLTYGNKDSRHPNYDISLFPDKIPEALSPLHLGTEQEIEKETVPKASPLFMNRTWLWAIMVLIIVMLGWFTLKMIKKG